MPDRKVEKKGNKAPIILGVILILVSIIFIFLKDYKNAYLQGVIGFFLIISGVFLKQATPWKEIPTGMKAVVIYFAVVVVLLLFNTSRNLTNPAFLFGVPVIYPLSLFTTLVPLLVNLFVILGIYKRGWWKLILGLLVFNFSNTLAQVIWILVNPISKIFLLMNQKLPDVAPEVLEKASMTAKIAVSKLLFVGVIIQIVILVYIFKNKQHFNKENKTKKHL